MTSRRRPSLVEQNSLRGRGHIAGKGVGRVAVETQQRLDLSAKSGGYLVLRVVLLRAPLAIGRPARGRGRSRPGPCALSEARCRAGGIMESEPRQREPRGRGRRGRRPFDPLRPLHAAARRLRPYRSEAPLSMAAPSTMDELRLLPNRSPNRASRNAEVCRFHLLTRPRPGPAASAAGFERAEVRRLALKPSLTFGIATPRSMAADPGRSRKSKSLKLYSRCTVFGSRSSFGTLTNTS